MSLTLKEKLHLNMTIKNELKNKMKEVMRIIQ